MTQKSNREEVISELLAEQDQEIAMLQEKLSIAEKIRESLARRIAGNSGNPAEPEYRESQPSKIAEGPLPEVIKAVLSHGNPMRATEIAAIIVNQGHKTSSKKGWLPSVISALRRRDDLFECISRGVYRLRS